MNVIDVGTLIYFAGNGTDRSETFRAPEGKRMTAVLESTVINMSGGSGSKVIVTLQQSSDLRNWTDVPFQTSHSLVSAPSFVRSETAGGTTPAYVTQPYVRLMYDGSTGLTVQVFVFSALLTLTET